MNDIEKILTGGGMVFKKKASEENVGEKTSGDRSAVV